MATNIEEVNKQVSSVDPTMNTQLPMDLSSIQASVAALSQSVGQFISERQSIADAVPKPEAPKAEPAKTGLLDAVRPKVEMPKRDLAADMAEYERVKQSAMASMGIGQAQFDELNQVNAETMTLSKELERLNLKEEAQIAQATSGFGLSSRAGAVENQIKRQMGLEKSNVAYQLSVKLGQADLIQGRIDKAEASFEKALDYATYKQDQAISDYKWALGFDLDLEKADRDYLQQQINNERADRAEIREIKMQEWQMYKDQYNMSDGDTTGLVGSSVYDGELEELYQAQPNASADQIARVYRTKYGIAPDDKSASIILARAQAVVNARDENVNAIAQATPEQTANSWLGGLLGEAAEVVPGYLQTEEGKRIGIAGAATKNIWGGVKSFFNRK